jgi:hypothetical protein
MTTKRMTSMTSNNYLKEKRVEGGHPSNPPPNPPSQCYKAMAEPLPSLSPILRFQGGCSESIAPRTRLGALRSLRTRIRPSSREHSYLPALTLLLVGAVTADCGGAFLRPAASVVAGD